MSKISELCDKLAITIESAEHDLIVAYRKKYKGKIHNFEDGQKAYAEISEDLKDIRWDSTINKVIKGVEKGLGVEGLIKYNPKVINKLATKFVADALEDVYFKYTELSFVKDTLVNDIKTDVILTDILSKYKGGKYNCKKYKDALLSSIHHNFHKKGYHVVCSRSEFKIKGETYDRKNDLVFYRTKMVKC